MGPARRRRCGARPAPLPLKLPSAMSPSTDRLVLGGPPVPMPDAVIQTPSLAGSAAGQGGPGFTCSALGSANSATPPLGTRALMQKQVKPDLHEARDTLPCLYPAGACRISSSAPQRAGARFLPQTQQLAFAACWALNLPHAQSPLSFPNIKGTGRFILPSAKPVSSLHRGKSRREDNTPRS